MPKVTGSSGASSRLRGLAGRRTIEMVGLELAAGADSIKAEASVLITQGSVSGKNHKPSLPGEPPMNDTGVLKGNIEAIRTAPLRAEVSSNAPYAVALENGTSKMQARPYMGPAARAKKDEIVARVTRAVSQAMKRK